MANADVPLGSFRCFFNPCSHRKVCQYNNLLILTSRFKIVIPSFLKLIFTKKAVRPAKYYDVRESGLQFLVSLNKDSRVEISALRK